MKTLGIDLSLNHTGWVLLQDTTVLTFGLIQPKMRGIERLVYIKNEFVKVIEKCGIIDTVVLESYSFGAKGRAVFQIGELGGVIKVLLAENGHTPYLVAPLTLKKFATGHGKGDKQLMLKEVFRKWAFDTSNNNLADAYALARFGLAIQNKDSLEMLNYEKECVNKVLETFQIEDEKM